MRVNIIPVAQPRACDACTLCCKVLALPEMDKAAGAWCRHAKQKRGCGIYEDRPATCANFRCVWLDGMLLDFHRPDRIHGVVVATLDGLHLAIHEDPGWPGHASRVLQPFIDRFIADATSYVVVVCGDRRRVIAHDRLMPRIESMLQEEASRVEAKMRADAPGDAP